MTRRLSRGLACVVFLFLAAMRVSPLGGQTSATTPARGAGIVAIRGATLVTVTKGTIPNGTIVLRDGKIAALGANISIPDGADVVDATGKFVSPGIIDAHSHIANDSINEGGTTVSSMTGIEDVIDPTDPSIFLDSRPAKQLRIDKQVGSLEVGKDADVVIWTHHPLSAYAIVERTYIDGIAYYERLVEERRLTERQKEKEPS